MDEPKTRASAWRRGLLWTAAVAVVLAGVAAALVALSLGWQRERLVAVLEEQLGDQLATSVAIGSLAGPLVGELRLQDVRLGSPDDPLLESETIVLRWDVRSLLPGRPWVIDSLEIRGAHLRLRRDAEGALDLPATSGEGPPPDLRIRLLRIVESRLSAEWSDETGPQRLAAALEAEVREVVLPGGGRVPADSGEVDLVVDASSLGRVRFERASLHAQLAGGRDVSFRADALGSFGRLGVSGGGDVETWLEAGPDADTRLDLEFHALDLGALAGNAQASTRLDGRGELRVGPRTAADGARELVFDGVLEESQISKVTLTGGRLRGRLLEDAWQVEEMLLLGDGVELRGSGSGAGDALADVELEARVENLDRLGAWLGGPSEGASRLAGGLRVEASLRGPVGRPDGSLRIRADDLVIDGRPLGDADLRATISGGDRARIDAFALDGGPLDVSAEAGGLLRRDGDGVVVEGLRLRSRDARLDVDGRLAADRLDALHLRMAGLRADRLPAPAEGVRATAGRLTGDVRLTGPIAAPSVEGWLQIDAGALELSRLGERLGPIDGRIRLADEVLSIESLTIGEPGGRAEIAGQLAVPGLRPERVDLRLRLQDFPLTRVPLPNREDTGEAVAFQTGGRVDADVSLSGPLSSLRVDGDVDWRQPRWEGVELDRIEAHVEGGMDLMQVTLGIHYLGRKMLDGRATLPIPERAAVAADWLQDDRARVVVEGRSLEFALLSPFLTRLVRDPRGTADVRLTIEGARPEPRIEGVVTVSGGSIRVPLLRQTFSPVTGSARFDGSTVELESIAVGSPGAGLRGSGRLELHDLRPERLDLAVELDGFPLSRSSLVETDLDGSLRLAGEVEAPHLSGDLLLRNTRVTVRSTQDPIYKEVRIRATRSGDDALVERSDQTPGLLDRASAEITLRLPSDTWFRSPDMELDVKGWATLEKRSFEPPRVAGQLDAVRGTVRVVRKQFRVRKGEARLDGSAELDPVIDLEAVHPVADVTIVAYVTGRVSAPVLRLESEPPLPEPDVVSYLFFGRPADQLGASEQGSTEMAAAGLAAGIALDELRDVLGADLPVDTIDLKIEEGDERSRVEVGKYVTRDIFVRYGQTFGSETEEEIGVSYRIGEHWRLESTTTSGATAGADVFWTIDY